MIAGFRHRMVAERGDDISPASQFPRRVGSASRTERGFCQLTYVASVAA